MNRFLYNRDHRHERINVLFSIAVNFDNVISASYAYSKCALNQFRAIQIHSSSTLQQSSLIYYQEIK